MNKDNTTPDRVIKLPVQNIGIGLFDADGRGVVYKFCDYDGENNPKVREFIATAINSFTQQAEEIERLKKEVAAANKGARINAHVNQSLSAKVLRYKTALEEYADGANWDCNGECGGDHDDACTFDHYEPPGHGYTIAAAALAEEGDKG